LYTGLLRVQFPASKQIIGEGERFQFGLVEYHYFTSTVKQSYKVARSIPSSACLIVKVEAETSASCFRSFVESYSLPPFEFWGEEGLESIRGNRAQILITLAPNAPSPSQTSEINDHLTRNRIPRRLLPNIQPRSSTLIPKAWAFYLLH
jgi:hypothetical protein